MTHNFSLTLKFKFNTKQTKTKTPNQKKKGEKFLCDKKRKRILKAFIEKHRYTIQAKCPVSYPEQ